MLEELLELDKVLYVHLDHHAVQSVLLAKFNLANLYPFSYRSSASRTGRVGIVGVGVEPQPSTMGPDPGRVGAQLSNPATS